MRIMLVGLDGRQAIAEITNPKTKAVYMMLPGSHKVSRVFIHIIDGVENVEGLNQKLPVFVEAEKPNWPEEVPSDSFSH